MNLTTSSILVATGLLVLQLLLALPWVFFAFLNKNQRRALRDNPFSKNNLTWAGGLLGGCLVLAVGYLSYIQDRDAMQITGRVFGAVLQVQITVDLFIGLFVLLLRVWSKGGAVAMAAFFEAVRQWLFWLLVGISALLMLVSIVLPYYTFGEDYIMVKQLGYDTILLAAVLFGALTASLSISEEIEGRTAITVMSKPISRRQFMLGKYLGIILAALFMFGVLGVYFEGVLFAKHWFEKLTPLSNVVEAQSQTAQQAYIGVTPLSPEMIARIEGWQLSTTVTDFLMGIAQWTTHTMDTLPGLILCFSQVMVLVGLSVSLATRLPMVVNMTTVLVVYFMSHLTPVLILIAGKASENQPNSPVPRVLTFVARVFDTILPDLGAFRVDPALLSDAPPDPKQFAAYVGSVTLYGLAYTTIVLLFGLILFEDRDLA